MTPKEAINHLLNTFCIEDAIYQVRDEAREGDYDEKLNINSEELNVSSWDHPAVNLYSDCLDVLKEHMKTL